MAILPGAIMPFIMQDYGIDYDTGGLLLSMSFCGNLLASYFVSHVIERLGRKKAIVILSSFITLGYIGIVSSSFIPLLMFCFLLTGISRGSISNVDNSVINDVAPGQPRYMTILHTLFAVGAFASPLAARFVMGMEYSWKIVAIYSIVLSACMVPVFALLPIKDGKKKKNAAPEELRAQAEFLKNPVFIFSVGVLFFYVGAEYAITGWLVTYLKDAGIMTGAQAQSIFSLLWAVIIVGRLMTAWAATRMRISTILSGSSICALVMFILFINTQDFMAIAAGVAGMGLFLAPMYPAAIAACGSQLKGNPRAMGILLTVAGLGGIIMPYIVGAVANIAGITAGMTSIGMTFVLMIVCSLALKFRTKS